MQSPVFPSEITLRTEIRPGDIGAIVQLHGLVYAQERGWDATFEAYVAGPLAEFVLAPSPHQHLWIAERGRRIVGCIAIVPFAEQSAQLRWFLVDPIARGRGLGKKLLDEAIKFCRDVGYCEIVLWTEQSLDAAARLYLAAGFHMAEEKPSRHWGAEVVEEKYVLNLHPQ